MSEYEYIDMDPSRTLTIKIGGRVISIYFKDGSDSIIPFCRSIFRQFIVEGETAERELEVCLLPGGGKELFGVPEDRAKHIEFALTGEQLTEWIDKKGKPGDGIRINNESIGIQSLSGLLIFTPENTCGKIYLPGKDRHPYRSLYRLFWIYFAQVLGEAGGCFLHAASMAKEGKGFVFIGGSGAGKSTLARLTNQGEVLSDEAPIVSEYGKEPRVFPSPYHQMDIEHSFGKPLVMTGVPIESICFIVRDDDTFIEPVSRRDAVAMLMARSIIFFSYVSSGARAKIFDLFHRTCHKLPINCLHYAMKTDVWKVLR